ncbi:hypothetical protein IL306_006602 [Fusarium sp. DS 682]|nr:hypothetical protein IL306_006602 [Fusarium sp. DS 682]
MQGGIMTSELPSAIHDAVVYTRALEVPFLWVDALCIIQGDREDWERESVLMADVYANALVTLAAECSASVHEGFIQSTDKLVELSTQPQHRFTATVAQGDGRQLTVQARALPKYDHHKTPPSTWSTRGWTLQERMLATRLVSFGHELKYTCQEASFNESCYLELRIDSRLDGHKALRAPQSQQEAFNLWQGMVCDYSRRSLTDCRDKLPAVSGVAKIMHKHTSSVYLAGIWKDNITRDILWYNPEPVTEETTASDVYLAPSFSWASISRPVYHDAHINDEDNDWHPVVELRDCGTEPAGPDAFGQVKSGYLVLSAPIITTTISLFPGPPRNSYDPDAKPTYSISISEELGVSQEMGDNAYGDFLYLDAAVNAIETKNADGKVEIAACRLYEEASVNDSLSTDLFKDNAQNPNTSSPGLASALCWLLYIGVFVGEEASTYEFIVLGKSLKQHDAFERLGLWSMPIESDASQEFKDRFHNMVNTAQIARVTII